MQDMCLVEGQDICLVETQDMCCVESYDMRFVQSQYKVLGCGILLDLKSNGTRPDSHTHGKGLA